jgi:hypothetical protein
MTQAEDEKPPILKSWRQVYALVLITEAVILIFLYLFTRYFK